MIVIEGADPVLSARSQFISRKTGDEIRKQNQGIGVIAGLGGGPGAVELDLRPQIIGRKMFQPLFVSAEHRRPLFFLRVSAGDGQFNLRRQRGIGKALDQIPKDQAGIGWRPGRSHVLTDQQHAAVAKKTVRIPLQDFLHRIFGAGQVAQLKAAAHDLIEGLIKQRFLDRPQIGIARQD